jgi:uncharacterized membrane protein
MSYNRDETFLQEDNKTVKNKDDMLLIPYLIEKTVITRLIMFAESVYDPFSAKQTTHFVSLVRKLINIYPTLNSKSENTKVPRLTATAFKSSFKVYI